MKLHTYLKRRKEKYHLYSKVLIISLHYLWLSVTTVQPYSIFPLFSLDENLPKPFYVWTFNENMGKWTNDPANWNQKWELVDGAICLKNVPTEPEVADDDLPWLAMKPKKENEVPKSAKAPLWSPPIPDTAGMHCITIDYNILVDLDESKTYGLSVLQQQDGWFAFSASLVLVDHPFSFGSLQLFCYFKPSEY